VCGVDFFKLVPGDEVAGRYISGSQNRKKKISLPTKTMAKNGFEKGKKILKLSKLKRVIKN